MFCFYLGSQACKKPVVFWSNLGEIPSILPAALGALSSPRRPMLLRALKESVAQFLGGRLDLCPVSFSFIFLSSHYLPLCLGLLPKGLSDTFSLVAGCLQSLESSAVMSMVRYFGHVILGIWVSGFLCPSGCSPGAAPHFVCRCTVAYPYETCFPCF